LKALISIIEGATSYSVEDQVIDSQMVQKILKDLKDRPELSKLTFENNDIKDFDGMCTVFSQLK
jgi:hypothetical protein